MLQKFSVSKPFTVLVGVILVIVLGVVSFTSMTTDLIPEMELPYSAIFTTYVGATPEQVERDVTMPIETRMATISGIEMVQSISFEHVSIVILQFAETTNMDSASIEIRESLDMVNLPDGVGKPMTIKMNPEMLPIMSVAMHMDDMSIDELTEFAQYELIPSLEAVPGVAVVNPSGLVHNQLHVVLRNEKVEEVNAKMADAVAAMMEAAMAEVMAQAEAMITAQVQEISEARMAELMMEGLTPEEAGAQLQAEMPAITEAVTEEVMAALGGEQSAEHGESPGEGERAIGLPAEMLSVDAITGLLMAQNFSMPAGMTVDGEDEYMIRVGDRFGSLDEIRNFLILDPGAMGLEGIDPVRLSDIADVFETDDSALSYSRVNGNHSITLSVQKQSEYSTSEVTESVQRRMDSLSEENPGLHFAVLMDQGEMIGMVIGSMLSSLLWGSLLAIVILLLFLRDIRPTLIVAVSIPVSLMLAFTLMYFTGVSMNMLSMGGLALAVGMLVDNSIVVIENIYRMRRTTDRSAKRAAVSGAKQVAGAIAASSLTTIAVFLPIVFTGGLTRQLFTDLALTIAYSLLASLIIALTVIPAASSAMLRKVKKTEEGKLWTSFVNGYEKALRFFLRYKWTVLLFAVAAFALSFWAVNRQGMELLPEMDFPQISITAEMPEGSTFEDTVAVADIFGSRVLSIDGVETVGVTVGGGGMMDMFGGMMGFGGMGGGTGEGTSITMYVLLDEDRSVSAGDVTDEIDRIIPELGLEGSAGGGMDLSMMMGEAISIRVEGIELDAIRDTAIGVAELVRSVEGTLNITDMIEEGAPELRITVDKDTAMANGLTVAQVFMAANSALTAPENSLNMMLDGKNYELIIQDGDFTLPDRAELENMQIATPAGSLVTLSDIAEIHEDTGFTSINRMNRNRYATISGEVADGYNVSLVNAEIERLLEDFVPADGCSVSIGGEAEAITDAFSDLFLMLALAILFIYLIMVAQFQSLLSPFIILLTIVLAFTGGFVALLITGMSLSIVSMIGLILLTGVVVNNGIVFISRVNQMRWEGMAKKDALVDAGRKRIRPILMTALTTIFAMSVMALGMGEGTEMMQPMAVVSIGGLLYATAMTLFVVPVLYDMFHKNKDITKENLDEPDSDTPLAHE